MSHRTRIASMILGPGLPFVLACASEVDLADNDVEQPASAEAKSITIGGLAYDPTSCVPENHRTLHGYSGAHAIRDLLPPWLEAVAASAGKAATKPELEIDVDAFEPKGHPRTFIVHTFPFDTVQVSPAGIKSLSWSAKPQTIYPLWTKAYSDPALLPDLPKELDPYGWADDFLKPMLVVAADKIELSGAIDLDDRGIMLIADTITVAPGTKIRSWVEPDWKGENNATKWPNPIHPGQVYLVAKKLELVQSKKVARKTVLKLDVVSDLISGNDVWKYPLVSGHAAILTSEPVAPGSIVGIDGMFSDLGAVNALLDIRTIGVESYHALLRHYAPAFLERAYYIAERSYRKRNLTLAKPRYEEVLAKGGLDPFGEAAGARLEQITLGLNYLGENDNVLPQEDVEALIEDAEATTTNLDFVELKYLYAVGSALDTNLALAELAKVEEAQEEEIGIAASDYDAATTEVEWAEAKLFAEKKKLDLLTGQQTDTFVGIEADFDAFKKKVKSYDCMPEPNWWKVIVNAVTLFVDVFSLDFGGVADSVGSIADSFDDVKASLHEISSAVKPVVEDLSPVIDDIGAIAANLEGLSDKMKQQLDDAAKSYEALYTHYEAQGVTWDPVNGGDGKCSYPKVAYPLPFELESLEIEILSTADAIHLAAIGLEEAKQLLVSSKLKVKHALAEKERTLALAAEIAENAKKLAAGFVVAYDADAASVGEQLCRVGQRIVDRLVRTTYDAARGLAYLDLEIENAGALVDGKVASLASTSGSSFAPKSFTFDYSFYLGNHQVLKDWIGVGQSKGLKQEYYDTLKNLGPSELIEVNLGASIPGVEASSLEELEETGVIRVRFDETAQAIAGLGPVRVQDVQVVLTGIGTNIRLVPEKVDANVYHVPQKPDLVVPLENIQFARKSASNWIMSDTSLVTIPPPGPILDQKFEPVFGLSLEGTWHIRLDPRVPANLDPAKVIGAATSATVVFRIFGQ